MKKIILILMFLAISAMSANIKVDFRFSLKKYDCLVDTWSENKEIDGIIYQNYVKVACKEAKNMPAKIVGLKFHSIYMEGNKVIYVYVN